MYVESIELSHYRNIDSAKVEFSPGINIFFGDNAQGKTNLLEAVYMCGTSRSHRGSKDRELIAFEEDEAHILMEFMKKKLSRRVDVHLRRNKSKGIAVDGSVIRRSSDLMGLLPMVFFSPEDLSIIKNGPAGRRKFLDMEMSQLDRGYLTSLIQYNSILSERNQLLKQIQDHPSLIETLDGWDMQLVKNGCDLIRKRERFVRYISKESGSIHHDLTGGREKLQVTYDKNVEEDAFYRVVAENRKKDIINGTTSAGPHRDDLKLTADGIDIRRFGPQGQQRTAAISLKLSEIRLIENMTGEKPVLLLDDVLSELDSSRQHWLMDSMKDIQIMVTCTGLEEFINRRIKMDRVFKVEKGKIEFVNNSTNISSNC